MRGIQVELLKVSPMEGERFLRIHDVLKITGLSKSQIYSLAKQEKFPQPIKLGTRASGWLCSEVADWIQQRIELSRLKQGF